MQHKYKSQLKLLLNKIQESKVSGIANCLNRPRDSDLRKKLLPLFLKKKNKNNGKIIASSYDGTDDSLLVGSQACPPEEHNEVGR